MTPAQIYYNPTGQSGYLLHLSTRASPPPRVRSLNRITAIRAVCAVTARPVTAHGNFVGCRGVRACVCACMCVYAGEGATYKRSVRL